MFRVAVFLGLIYGCLSDGHNSQHVVQQPLTATLFHSIDTNGNHRVDKTEFTHLFMGFDTWPEDGQVSEHEFVQGWNSGQHHHVSGLFNDNYATLFFFHADRDHDFEITQDDVNKLFVLFHPDGSTTGQLTQTEFDTAWGAYFS